MSGVRFAPSPTGEFHIGNLRTAWISWWWAKKLNRPWVVRFEDIDRPRVLPGAQDKQLHDLKELGLVPDEIIIQSKNHERHWRLFTHVTEAKQVYPCVCSRKEVADVLVGIASAPHAEPPLYSGHCRHALASTVGKIESVAWRFKNPDDESGRHDFIVARTSSTSLDSTSFTPAYHWACAIDDYDGNYDLLVRAWDLSHAAAAQRLIQNWAAKFEKRRSREIPIFHCSLVVQNNGERLEKRTQGVTLRELYAQGHTPQRLVEIFASGFAKELGQEPGERDRALTLGDLL